MEALAIISSYFIDELPVEAHSDDAAKPENQIWHHTRQQVLWNAQGVIKPTVEAQDSNAKANQHPHRVYSYTLEEPKASQFHDPCKLGLSHRLNITVFKYLDGQFWQHDSSEIENKLSAE